MKGLAPISTGLDALTGAWLPSGGGSLAAEVSETRSIGATTSADAVCCGASSRIRSPSTFNCSGSQFEFGAVSPAVSSISSDVAVNDRPSTGLLELCAGRPDFATSNPAFAFGSFATGLVACLSTLSPLVRPARFAVVPSTAPDWSMALVSLALPIPDLVLRQEKLSFAVKEKAAAPERRKRAPPSLPAVSGGDTSGVSEWPELNW
jgi:hypothetical protein